MSARDPGMSKAIYATNGGFKPATPGKKLQMSNVPMKTTPSPGTKTMAAANPKPASGVTYGAKPGLHDAPKSMPKRPAGKGTLVD